MQAVQGKTEILMDGGIRGGQDVLRAIELGADGVMNGRVFLYALGAAGQAGVERCLEIIKNELEVSMALCGKNTMAEINKEVLLNPTIFDRKD